MSLPFFKPKSDKASQSSDSGTEKASSSTPDRKSRRKSRLPRSGHNYSDKISKESIIKATQHHISYTWNSTTLTGLDKYDDCTPYDISESSERQYIEAEVDRLVDSAVSSEALLFSNESNNPNAVFAADVGKAFEELACLADQIRCAMGIIRLDNARVSMEHSTDLDESVHAFRQARRRLMGRFQTDQTEVRGSAPKSIEPPVRNSTLCFQLVDFITEYVARLLVRTAVSDYWSQQIFSCLAACTVKIKILLRDTEKYANLSISSAEESLEQIKSRDALKETFVINLRENPDDAGKDVDTVDTETDASRNYHHEKTMFHHQIFWLIRRALSNLLVRDDRQSEPDCFAIFTSLYRARTDGLPTTLTSDRVGEVSLSSDTFVVQNSHTSMALAVEGLTAIQAKHQSKPPSPSCRSRGKDDSTRIEYQWVPHGPNPEPKPFSFTTNDIMEVISALVPLAFCSVPAAASVAGLITAAGLRGNEKDPIRRFEQPHRACEGNILVTTAAWIQKERDLANGDFHDDEIAPLTRVASYFRGKGPFAETEPITESYRKHTAEMAKWIISETAITIKCPNYTRAVIAIAAIILCGGLTVPFTVQDKLPGVDPFNVTMFSWLIAGLVIVFAKGKYVSEWPWHEFIHGHVICRTLKEVCDVSRRDSQEVIMYLLLNEWRTLLRTEGPFNTMFSRRVPEGSGFTINEPTRASTMLASGLLLLKVLNVTGEHIICLDARRGSDYVSPNSLSRRLLFRDLEEYELEQEISIELMDEDEKMENKDINPAKQLRYENIRVDRVVGMYTADSYFG